MVKEFYIWVHWEGIITFVVILSFAVVCASSRNILVAIKSKYKEKLIFSVAYTLLSQKIILLLVIALLVKINV